jgi:hypothetical protein
VRTSELSRRRAVQPLERAFNSWLPRKALASEACGLSDV